MSFSHGVKKEISHIPFGDRHCRVALLASIINSCGKMTVEDSVSFLQIKNEGGYSGEVFAKLAQTDFSLPSTEDGNHLRFLKTAELKKLLWATRLMDRRTGVFTKRISPLIVKNSCCRRAYLRGAFLCQGSISDPAKAYHMEFSAGDREYAKEIMEIMEDFGLKPKQVTRKGCPVVYFKEGEQIADILNIIGAHVSLMEFENYRVGKDMSNSINRASNCAMANADKAITAAVNHVRDIEMIDQAMGLDRLPPPLKEAALARLAYPLKNMQEIGQLLNPPVGKSGVNHRLRKISKIAEKLREG